MTEGEKKIVLDDLSEFLMDSFPLTEMTKSRFNNGRFYLDIEGNNHDLNFRLFINGMIIRELWWNQSIVSLVDPKYREKVEVFLHSESKRRLDPKHSPYSPPKL